MGSLIIVVAVLVLLSLYVRGNSSDSVSAPSTRLASKHDSDKVVEPVESGIISGDNPKSCELQIESHVKDDANINTAPLASPIVNGNCGQLDKHGSAISFVIDHAANEGSHFISEQIQHRLACVRMDTRENFDTRRNPNRDSVIQEIVLQRFLDANSSDFISPSEIVGDLYTNDSTNVNSVQQTVARLSKEFFGLRPSKARGESKAEREKFDLDFVNQKKIQFREQCGSSEIRGALVRVSAPVICQFRPLTFITVRTDLMRASLAGYEEDVHAQFSTNFKTEMRTYDMKLLNESAQRVIGVWHNIVEKVVAVRECGVEPQLLRYEEWTSQTDQAFEQVRKRFEACGGIPARVRNADERRAFQLEHPVCVHKAHSNIISDFAVNAVEIEDFFSNRNFPTFDEVAQRILKLHELN